MLRKKIMDMRPPRHTFTISYKNVKKQEKKLDFANVAVFHHARVIFASESDLPQKPAISILCDSDIIWRSYAILKIHIYSQFGTHFDC